MAVGEESNEREGAGATKLGENENTYKKEINEAD
jgi:hypothetical protein